MTTAASLHEEDFNLTDTWKSKWNEEATDDMKKLPCIADHPPGFNLPRKSWVTLNRIRTKFGKCGDLMFKWGINPSPACNNCGAPKQTIHHIVMECPLTSYKGNFEDFLNATDAAIDYVNNLNVSI